MASLFRSCRRCGRVYPPAQKEPAAEALASVVVLDAAGEETDYHGRPLSLRIKLPKRTRWPAYDERAKEAIVAKTRRGLSEVEATKGRSERLRLVVELYHELIAQPLLLATHPTFRLTAINRREEISQEVRNSPTSYDEEWFEVEYAWDNLMAELPDHPLYKED